MQKSCISLPFIKKNKNGSETKVSTDRKDIRQISTLQFVQINKSAE